MMNKDWIEVELGEVCFTTSGGTPSRNNTEFYQGTIPWVKSGELDKGIIYDTEEHISEEAVKKSSAKIFPEGSLLIALYGATIGKLAFLGVKASTNQAICGIYKNEFIESKYLYNFLLNRKQKLISQGTGGAQPNISQTILKKLEIPLAPLPIQRAIVSKLEALFSDLDNGIAHFKKAQAQLKIYRQAVLKKAFEGGFTEGVFVSDGELRDGWKVEKISDIADTFGGYAFKSGDFKETGKYQVLRMGNVRPGILRYNENPVFLDAVNENVLEKSLLKISDLIITQTGTKGKRDYGFTALINKNNVLLNQRIAAVRCKQNCLPKYLLYFTWTDKFKNQFFENETGNVGQGNVGMKAVTNTLIDVPSIAEQAQIVAEIESRLSVCDKMEQSLTESIAKAEALRQSILKRAFEGKLLSAAEIAQCQQAADYEPAGVLLERIKAEKLAKEKKSTPIKNKIKQ